MKSISILILTLFTLSGMSQSYSFKPKWENGTVKTLEMSTSTKEYKNGELTSDTTTFNEAKITVTKDLKTSYELEAVFENQVLTAAQEFYAKIGEELGEFSSIKIKLSVSKETGKVSVLNPKEVKDFYTKGFDQITELMEEKVPEIAPFMKLALSPINKMFENKENLEAYAKEMVGFVFVPFEHEYTLNEPLIIEESTENPFNPSQEISSTTTLSLNQSAIAEPNQFEINESVALDLSQFMEMIKDMMKGMSAAFGANDSITNAKTDEMDDFKMDMTNLKVISFNNNTTWVEKMVGTAEVISTDPKSGIEKKKAIITTVVVK